MDVKDVYETYFYIKNNGTKKGNWENVKKRISKNNLENIQKLTDYFNTKWQNINIVEYMKTGFEIWKGFGPKYFLNEKLLKEYIRKDKSKKRNLDISDDEIKKSFKYINKKYKSLYEYANKKINNVSICLYDYLELKIDTLTLTYLIYRNYLKPEGVETFLIPYIVQRYDELKKLVIERIELFKSLENGENLNEKRIC